MKISDLIYDLIGIQARHGDITVYTISDSSVGVVEDPFLYVSEGGTEYYPYPGLYLN